MYGDKDYLEYSDVVKLSYMMQVRNEDREKNKSKRWDQYSLRGSESND